jgi:large subunit ribosomal protein L2
MGKRLIQQKRGGGRPRYISPSHRHLSEARHPVGVMGECEVIDLEHAPGRSTPLARVRLPDGKTAYVIPHEGLRVGDRIAYTDQPSIERGHTTLVSKIPEGTPVFNIESSPGDGGRFVRSAGSYAVVVGHSPRGTVVQMPSGQLKRLHPSCRATIGNAAGGGRGEKPLMKAGKQFHKRKSTANRFPVVRGVAMNPVSHPHGGGSHNYPGGPTSKKRGTPPRANVGKIAPKRTGKR